MKGKHRISAFVFSAILLLLACTIKSDVIIDRSFLPRFLLLSLLMLVFFLTSVKKNVVPEKNLFVFSLFAFYLWNLISSLWALSPQESLMQSQLILSALAVWVLVTHLIRDSETSMVIFIRFLMVLLVFSFTLTVYRIWSIPFFDPYMIKSICANNNLYSGFLLLSIPFLLTGYSLQKGIWKYVTAVIVVLSLFFIIILQSRAVYLGFFLAVTIFLILVVTLYREMITRRNILTASASLLVLAGMLFLFYNSLDPTRKAYFLSKVKVWDYFGTYENPEQEKIRRYNELVRAGNGEIPAFDHAGSYYENASLRMIFWKKSLCLIKSHPIAGVGAGNWNLAIPSCPDPPNPDHTRLNYTYSQPHNEAVSILSELGIIGLGLAFMVFILPLVIVFSGMARKKPPPSFSVAIFASFITGFYLFSFFDFPLKRVEHNILLFSALAFLLVKVPSGALTARWLPVVSGRIISGIMIFLLLISLAMAGFRIAGEYYTLRMFRYERQDDDRVIAFCRKARNIFYEITPNTLPLDWFEGVGLYRKGKLTEAVVCFERALERTPYEVRVLNDYGASLYAVGSVERAKEILQTTLRIDPFFDDARFNLSAIHYFSGRPDSALFYILPCRDSQKKREFLEELGVHDTLPGASN